MALNYCGIDAQFRSCGAENTNHFNVSVILSNGDKYIVDGTPFEETLTRDEVTSYLNGLNPHSYEYRVVTWSDYESSFTIPVTFR